jgi:hypothetical protein
MPDMRDVHFVAFDCVKDEIPQLRHHNNAGAWFVSKPALVRRFAECSCALNKSGDQT